MTKQYYETYWEDQDELEDLGYKWPAIKPFFPEGKHTFLDFGCGTGVLTEKIHAFRPDYKIHGVDISPKALRASKKRIPKGTFQLIRESQHIPFPDRSFDIVLAADVLEHIYDTSTAFSELARVLTPGGTLLISAPYNGKLKMIVAIIFGFEFYFDPMSPHIRHFSPKTLRASIEKTGMKVLQFGYFGRFFPLSRGMFCIATK